MVNIGQVAMWVNVLVKSRDAPSDRPGIKIGQLSACMMIGWSVSVIHHYLGSLPNLCFAAAISIREEDRKLLLM